MRMLIYTTLVLTLGLGAASGQVSGLSQAIDPSSERGTQAAPAGPPSAPGSLGGLQGVPGSPGTDEERPPTAEEKAIARVLAGWAQEAMANPELAGGRDGPPEAALNQALARYAAPEQRDDVARLGESFRTLLTGARFSEDPEGTLAAAREQLRGPEGVGLIRQVMEGRGSLLAAAQDAADPEAAELRRAHAQVDAVLREHLSALPALEPGSSPRLSAAWVDLLDPAVRQRFEPALELGLDWPAIESIVDDYHNDLYELAASRRPEDLDALRARLADPDSDAFSAVWQRHLERSGGSR